MSQCQDCHKERWPWKSCPAIPQWFSPSDISYCPYQVEWILANLVLLKEGKWPPEHLDTGYYDSDGCKIRRGSAYYEVPICVAIDVELRLERCGKDGLIARQCLAEGWDEQTLALVMGRPVSVIQAKIKKVINYCSGFRPRKISYYEFNRRHGIAKAMKIKQS